MELMKGIETRRSYRAFKPTPIPSKIIEHILEAASKCPSYTNTQPWEVAIVSGKKKEELSNILYGLALSDEPQNPDIPLVKTWPIELERRSKEHTARRFKALGIERDNETARKELRLQNFRFYGAPCVLFLFMDSTLTTWSIFDMGLFAQNILLSGHSLGIGSCLQAQLAVYPNAVRDFLGIPKTKRLIIGVSIGYPDLESRINSYQSIKLGIDEFTKWYS